MGTPYYGSSYWGDLTWDTASGVSVSVYCICEEGKCRIISRKEFAIFEIQCQSFY